MVSLEEKRQWLLENEGMVFTGEGAENGVLLSVKSEPTLLG